MNKAEERLRKLNECFLDFGSDPIVNVNKLVALCGELMEADCALYNRLDKGMLCSWGQWNVPLDYKPVDKPEGHICYDVITLKRDDVVFIPNLLESRYAQTDPGVQQYKLKTYIGKAVRLGNENCGSLCVVYQKDFIPSVDDRKLISAIASAIGVEEKRRQAEENLRQAEEKYRSLMESTEDSIYVVGIQHICLFMNKQYLSKLGLSEGAFLGRTYSEFHSPEETKEFTEMADSVFKTGKSLQHEHRDNKDGRYYLWTLSPIRNGNGAIEAVTVISKDITYLKRIEEELRLFSAAVEAAPDGVQITDLSGKIIYSNKAVQKIYGFFPEELYGRHVNEMNVDPEFARKVIIPYIRDAGEWSGELAVKHKEGGSFTIWLTCALVKNDAGQPIAILGIIRDLTRAKEMEQELRRIHKLESVGVLAGGIAHDFNNLLTGILGSIDLSKMHVDKESRTYRRLEEAERATMRAAELTQQLLTFSRGGAPIKRAASVVEIIKESARFALSGSNVKCVYQFADNLWSVEVDEGQMHQVFHNLVINADQAMPEGGIITVNANNAVLGVGGPLQAGKYIMIVIEDQGTGISEEHIQKIFDPYFTTKEKGRGLGLAVVYSIIKNHGGHITVRSKVGVGTTFTLYLPATEKPSSEEKASKEEPIVGGGRILLMDDEKVVRDIAGEILKVTGYEVEFAKDGQEAIELYRKAEKSTRPFDVVIMDLTVPGGMGGKEAIKTLREINPSVKAVVSSGYANDPIMANFRDYGFDAVIPKPYSGGDLSRIVHKVLGRAIFKGD
ncbi:MAG TPA: hypothetical protein DCP92_08485 [Nitrospiraceae bacterium]|nr:hypothetical protein [Nitrospiraceae bacterium]